LESRLSARIVEGGPRALASTKAAAPSKYDKACAAVARLPVAWQGAFHDKIALSETGKARAGDEP